MSKGSRQCRSDGERRQHRGDNVYENRLFTNDEHMRWAEDPSGLDEEQGTGDVPAIRQAWHSKRQKGAFLNHQTNMASFQAQPSIKSDGPGNGETRCHQGDVINKDCSKVNDESMRRSRGTSAVDKKQGTGNKPDPQLPMCSRTCETSHNGLQTASPAFQKKPSIKLKGPRDREMRQRIEDRSSLVTEESRGDHNRTGVRKHLYMNIEPNVSNNENSCLSEKVVNGRWTACITPSLTNKKGGAPVTQRPTRSKMRNRHEYGPQMTADSPQRAPMSGACIQCLEEAWGGLHIRRGGGTDNGRRSKPNINYKKKLTSLSVKNIQEQSTDMYSMMRIPKMPDKDAWHVEDRYDPKAHNAPQPKKRDCVEQSLKQQDTSGRQRSLCDSRHTSHDTMHERVAERGEMECAHPTYPTCQVHGPYWDQDSDDSLSSESGVGNEGPEWRAKNNTEQLSECSDELSEARSDIREPDEELTGPQPETVHMACMRDHHHYTVYRDMNNGKGPSQNDISDNGIYRDNDGIHWAYKEEFIECSDPTGCGSPVENHWKNGKPAEWLENVDLERYSKKEESDVQEDESTDGSDDQGDELTDESDDQEDELTDELDDQEDEPTDESDDQDDEPTDESDEY
jgi:hypothetical protein